MKRTIALVVAVLLAAGVLTTMRNASAATNLIGNPSAEKLALDGTPIGWSAFSWGDTSARHEVSNRPKSGKRSMLLSVDSRSYGSAAWTFDPVAVKPAKQYVFSDYYRSDTDSVVTLELTTVNGERRHYMLPGAGASPNRYRKYSVTFTTTVDVAAITVRHSIESPGYLRTDKFSLTESRGNPNRTPLPEPMAGLAPVPSEGPTTPIPNGAPDTGGGGNGANPVDPAAPAGYPLMAGDGAYVSTLGVSSSALPYKSSGSLLWNRPLPASTPLDPNSAGQVSVIGRYARSGGGMANNYPGIFEDMENAPQTFVVDSDKVAFTPVRFACPGAGSWWNYSAAEFENYINNVYPGKYGVPIPAGVSVSNTSQNSDSPVAIYDFTHDVQFNFWLFQGSNGNYTACWAGHSGGQYAGVKDTSRCNAGNMPATFSTGDGTFCYPFGEDTAGFTDLGTNITLEEAHRGSINHAISISIPQVREDGYSFPATRFNGWCNSLGIAGSIGGAQNCLYVGQRLRLPADFDTSTIANPFTRMVAEAAKTYGFIVHDTGGCMCIQSESGLSATSRGMANPWDAIYGAGGNKGAYDAFPWESLQVLAKDYQY